MFRGLSCLVETASGAISGISEDVQAHGRNPIIVLMAKAVIRLRPDLGERISAGELTVEDAESSGERFPRLGNEDCER